MRRLLGEYEGNPTRTQRISRGVDRIRYSSTALINFTYFRHYDFEN
jgi:hypothetical protein